MKQGDKKGVATGAGGTLASSLLRSGESTSLTVGLSVIPDNAERSYETGTSRFDIRAFVNDLETASGRVGQVKGRWDVG